MNREKNLWHIIHLFLNIYITDRLRTTKETNSTQNSSQSHISYTENSLSYSAKVDSKSFYFYKDGQWQKEFIKGVNMGASLPGKFPGEWQ